MNGPSTSTIRFRLSPVIVPFAVDLELRRSGTRWVAVARIGGCAQTGLAATARAALAASLATVSAPHRTALLADPALLAPSRELIAQEAG